MSSSLFTPAARSGLLVRLAAGASLVAACAELELKEPTVRGWLTRGRNAPAGEYGEFAAAVALAREAAIGKPSAMDEAELAVVVSARAREGVVSAMELRWKMLTAARGEETKPDAADDPLAEADELARRRQAR